MAACADIEFSGAKGRDHARGGIEGDEFDGDAFVLEEALLVRHPQTHVRGRSREADLDVLHLRLRASAEDQTGCEGRDCGQ